MHVSEIARFADDLADGVPLLVVRLPALERIAWREGLRRAHALEKRAAAAFVAAAARVLRAGDRIAHDAGSDVFVAALTAPRRDGASAPGIDVRSALARIALALERATQLDVEFGWTVFARPDDVRSFAAAVGRALARGAQERERYAFFSALGHELRTPLSSIRGYLETLLEPRIAPPVRDRFVRIAHAETLRLARLIDGMFEISLLDLGGGTHAADDACADLADVVAAACDACAASANARAVRIVREAAPRTAVAIDPDRLTLVFVNVIENAIKHGRAGGTVAIAVDLGDGARVRVTVDDDGPGVDRALRDRIFALGERGTTDAPGTGIGLTLVRLMLERAGGAIEAGASPLGGARFTVALPRAAYSVAARNRSR